ACGAPATQNAQPTAGGEAPAGGEAQAPAQNNGVKLIFMSDTSNEAIIKVRNEWASKFSAQNSGVTVEHQPVPQEYATKIQTLFAAGTPPDVYRYLQEITPIVTVAEKKLHVPLNSYVQRDSYDLSDYRPDSIELYRWEGELYGLPRDYGNQNLFYNIDLLEAAGIQPPPADWTETSFTFENFVQMAKELTKKNGDRIEQYGFLVNRGWRPWASWVYNNGAAVVNKDATGLATEIALTDPKAVEALQLLQDMMYKDPVAPRPDIESETGGFELFASGKVGIMLTNPSDVVKFRKIDTFKWDVGTLPIGKASRRGTGGGGTGWAIPSGSKNPDVAWEFLKFISSAEAQLDEVHVGATTPSRVSVITSKDFADPNQPPAHISAFAQAQEYVVRDPVHPRWPEIFQRVLTPTMDQLWGGTKTAAEVAEMIKTEGDKLLKQA
ncbi:MAG TPA: sugar ABC transporter substrate-binding protein, partial [Roseiflexaceae bacterium]|nr:sugar ABC transporter substrate-binding protein [Roseiflexaceae bacterium]